VHGSVLDNANGKLKGVAYNLQQFIVADAAATASSLTNVLNILPAGTKLVLTLNLSGFTTTAYSTLTLNGGKIVIDEISADVSGTGVDVNGTPALVKGTVDFSGRTIKVE